MPRQYWDEMSRDLRPVYTAPSEAAAKERFAEFSGKWGRQYPAITRLWENAWSEFVPFLDYATWKSGGSSAARTPSSPLMPGTGARSGPEVIFPPSRRP
jgi:hypothetical protein